MWHMRRGGGNRVLFEVANRLERKGHSVTFTTLGYPGSHSWFPLSVSRVIHAEEKFGLPIVKRPLSGAIDFALAKARLPYVVDRIKVLAKAIPKDIDVNVATFCMTAFAVHRSGTGRPFYYIQHFEPLFSEDNYSRAMVLESYYLKLNNLVVSEWLKKLIMELVKEEPILIGNGVNIESFHPRQVKKPDYPVVSSIVRGMSWKGDRDVFEALSVVTDRIPNVKLLVTGDRHAFQLLKMKYPQIRAEFVPTPTDEQLAYLYSTSSVFVFASYYEGFGLPPLEAMSCGTPVVSTDNLGVRDYAVQRRNALIVPPHDPEKLATAIIEVLSDDDLARELGRDGQNTSKQFSFENVAEKVAEAFESRSSETLYSPNELTNRMVKYVT